MSTQTYVVVNTWMLGVDDIKNALEQAGPDARGVMLNGTYFSAETLRRAVANPDAHTGGHP